MTTSHWCHHKWVTLVKLHRLWYPRILLFSSKAAAGPLSPGVHLPFCRKQERKNLVTVTPNSQCKSPNALIHTNLKLTALSLLLWQHNGSICRKSNLNKDVPQQRKPTGMTGTAGLLPREPIAGTIWHFTLRFKNETQTYRVDTHAHTPTPIIYLLIHVFKEPYQWFCMFSLLAKIPVQFTLLPNNTICSM